MVKLIVCDIDGTLIPYGQPGMDGAIFPLIRGLQSRGIQFCPASGRQFHSLRALFAPVAEELVYLCENGAVLYGPGSEEAAPVLGKTAMPRGEAVALAEAILAEPGCEVLISGANTSYVCGCGEAYIRYMRDFKGNRVAVLERPADVPEELIKVSAYCPGGLEGPSARFGPRWGEALHMVPGGPDWLDFSLSDKGTGLAQLCGALGVAPAETLAFGDNWNDEPMLSKAGRAYLMEGADPVLLARFPRHCASVAEVLEQYLGTGKLP